MEIFIRYGITSSSEFHMKLLLTTRMMCHKYRKFQQGVLDNGEEIAVKKLHQHQMLYITDKQFKNEVINLMRAQHENIVRLVGYCHHTSQIFVEYEGKHVSASVVERAICFEYMQGGSLDDQLSGMILLYLH